MHTREDQMLQLVLCVEGLEIGVLQFDVVQIHRGVVGHDAPGLRFVHPLSQGGSGVRMRGVGEGTSKAVAAATCFTATNSAPIPDKG